MIPEHSRRSYRQVETTLILLYYHTCTVLIGHSSHDRHQNIIKLISKQRTDVEEEAALTRYEGRK